MEQNDNQTNSEYPYRMIFHNADGCECVSVCTSAFTCVRTGAYEAYVPVMNMSGIILISGNEMLTCYIVFYYVKKIKLE